MAPNLGPLAFSKNMRSESRTPKLQSSTQPTISHKKRQSRDNPVLSPDPFRYGNLNPLDCHPCHSNKHPEHVSRPQAIERPVSFPVLYSSSGPGRLSLYGPDGVEAYRSQGFVPRLLRNDSLVNILEFFEKNTLSRAMSHSFKRRHSDISAQKSVRKREVAVAQRKEEEEKKQKAYSTLPNTPPPTPQKAVSRPILDHHTALDNESNSDLPKEWKEYHDRFIAYLDTHAPLTHEGETQFRESKKARYTVVEMVSLLKEKFDRFQTIPIPAWAIERRLEILDYQENKYFDMPYSSYTHEAWGEGI